MPDGLAHAPLPAALDEDIAVDSTDPAPDSSPNLSFSKLSYNDASRFLLDAHATGRLGSGPAEDRDGEKALAALFRTLPWGLLIVQLMWSSIVVGVGYKLGEDLLDDEDSKVTTTLSVEFWASKLVLDSAVVYGVGWALFIMLGFFLREASTRYRESQTTIAGCSAHLRKVVRRVRRGYPPGTWHPGDIDRIAAHLIAYLVALKMELRGEREAAQLEPLIGNKDDLADILAAESMHLHCARVVRAYFSAANPDSSSFGHIDATEDPTTVTICFNIMTDIDNVDSTASQAMRIANFRPAVGYVNHLRIFLLIWLMFVPLSLLDTSGWFTVLFALLITYAVGMLFNIAKALNEPYGFDVQDVKLNRLCSKLAHDVLVDYTNTRLGIEHVVRAEPDAPDWLSAEVPSVDPIFQFAEQESGARQSRVAFGEILRRIWSRPVSLPLVFGLSAFLAWGTFVILITYFLGDDAGEIKRWWTIYIPVSVNTATYVSLVVFLLLGFWISDAYGRYSRGLRLWQTDMRAPIMNFAYQLSLSFDKRGLHEDCRRRVLSHVVALFYAAKQQLRDSRDLSELEDILAPRDLQALAEAPDLTRHVLNVLSGYVAASEYGGHPGIGQGQECPLGSYSGLPLDLKLDNFEAGFSECMNMRRFPISQSFTVHLRLLAAFWLALLPLVLVEEDGFITYAYLLPIGYSIINLLIIGDDMADPFGFDKNDIPVDDFCVEMKNWVIVMNREHATFEDVVHTSEYRRKNFSPRPGHTAEEDDHDDDHSVNPSFKGIVVKLLSVFPRVSPVALLVAFVWTVIAVVSSYFLRLVWSEDKRNFCAGWCSPIDVQSEILGNLGFGLFLILTFRASDGIQRYQDGAFLMHEMEQNMRTLAISLVQMIRDGDYHENDKERIIAHLVQIPLYFRDCLLGKLDPTQGEKDGLLSPEDRERFEKSSSPMEYLLRTVEGYQMVFGSSQQKEIMSRPAPSSMYIYTKNLGRFTELRKSIYGALAVKRFPVIASYTKHQHLFTALWIALLPLSMTQSSGWFTILWSPIITYGVFGLEAIATQLVDPFGLDATDIPVADVCKKMSSTILEAVNENDWGVEYHTQLSVLDTKPELGVQVVGNSVVTDYTLGSLKGEGIGGGRSFQFGGPREPKTKPSKLAHFLRSVPWWVLTFITAWTTVACLVSYLSRKRNESEGVRWWVSVVSINTSVASYLSFTAFTLLGFFVNAAYSRYLIAGDVWVDAIRGNCHALAYYCLSYSPPGAIHEGDHERIVGHIAAIPLAFKAELRGSRDVRDLKGLLSFSDLAKIANAKSMSMHCLDVVRSYLWLGMLYRQERISHMTLENGIRLPIYHNRLLALENSLQRARFMTEFHIPPGFVILLNALLTMFFLLIPFVLAEISGWLTILWVPIIAYGVLGMYSIAMELQDPYGTDLNDLDLDEMADIVVEDVIDVYRKQHETGWKSYVHAVSGTPSLWSTSGDESADGTKKGGAARSNQGPSRLRRVMDCLRLALLAIPLPTFLAVVLWTTFAVGISFWVSEKLPFSSIGEDNNCGSWFCSAIAIDSSVQRYIGFALFLLLGFRLYDSHHRYVEALQIWQDGIIGMTRLFTTRFFESYKAGAFHEDALARVAGFVSAHAICVMGSLRNMDYREKLLTVLSEEDVDELLAAYDRSEYCIDVLRSYMIDTERLRQKKSDEPIAGGMEHYSLHLILYALKEQSKECYRIVRVPMPYGYVLHLRVFLLIYVALLPFGQVEATGWLTILWIAFIAYGVIGIERWAEELSDPFGFDLSDVPLEHLCDRVISETRDVLHVFTKGSATLIRQDRGEQYVGDLGNVK